MINCPWDFFWFEFLGIGDCILTALDCAFLRWPPAERAETAQVGLGTTTSLHMQLAGALCFFAANLFPPSSSRASTLMTSRQRSSTYLPVAPIAPSPAPSSPASSRDTSRRSKDPKSRLSEGAMSSTKRRSTMNSRDAAYDEEELIRRVIEESKEDNKTSEDETTIRRRKRSRSDSEAYVPCIYSHVKTAADMPRDLVTGKGPSANGQLHQAPISPRNRVALLLSLLRTTSPKPNPQRMVPEDKELRLEARRKWRKS
jgi:hypothetical protein